MRLRVVVLFGAPLLAWAQPAFVTGPLVSNISHSAVRVTWITDSQPTKSEVEWGPTASYGSIRTAVAPNASPYTASVLISGLTPGSAYHCRGRLNDGAVVSGDVVFTTLAEPSPHPALPEAPTPLTVSMPVINGNTYNVLPDCSNLQSTLNTIASLTGSANHEIVLPPGTTCYGNWKFPARPSHSGWVLVRSSAVGTAAFPPEGVRWTKNWNPSTTLAKFVTQTFGGSRGTYIPLGPCTDHASEGGFFFASNLPASLFGLLRCSDAYPPYTGATLITSMSGSLPVTVEAPGHTLIEGQAIQMPDNGYVAAERYRVYDISGNTFKLYAAQIGSYIGGVNMIVLTQWRTPTHTVSSIDPSGSCTSEHWWYNTNSQFSGWWCAGGTWTKFLFQALSDSNHSAIEILGSKYYFAGIEATSQQYPGYPDSFPAGWDQTSASLAYLPGHLSSLVNVTVDDAVFDRSYIHGQPKPARNAKAFGVVGDRFALMNSHLEDFQGWRMGGYNQGAGSTGISHYSGTQALIHNNYLESAGINYFAPDQSYGTKNEAVNHVTITRNTFKKRPEWRRTGAQPLLYPNRQAWELKQGHHCLVRGNVFDYNWSGITAGSFMLITPRCRSMPSAFSLTGWSGSTITLASSTATFEPGDVIYLTGTDAEHDRLWEIAGNGCPSSCQQVTLLGSPTGSGSGGSALLRASGRTVTDVDVRDNSFYQGTEIFRVAGSDGDCTIFKPPQTKRVRFSNNLMVDMNIRRYSDGGRQDFGGVFADFGDFGARFLYAIGDVEDLTATHNTLFGSRGNTPTLLVANEISGGLRLSDNIHTFNESGLNAVRGGSAQGTATLNEKFRRDSTPNWTSLNNVMCCGKSSYSGSYPASFRWPAAEADVKWLNASLAAPYNFRLRHDSPYISGGANRASDDMDAGVDMDALEAAQGRVSNARAWGLTASAANIAYLAPDSAACTVEYGTAATWGTGTRVSDSGGDRARNVPLSGLARGTLYHYRVLCAVEQPAGSFRTP